MKEIQACLRDGTRATLNSYRNADELPQGLLEFLHQEFNREIARGTTYPQEETLTLESFCEYWFQGDYAAVLIASQETQSAWQDRCLGFFYVRPNFGRGRAEHLCNAGFVVNSVHRNRGVGLVMGSLFLQVALQLGYLSAIFNLVFVTNIASCRIWDSLGFERVAVIKEAGRLRGHEKLVDAIMYRRDLTRAAGSHHVTATQ